MLVTRSNPDAAEAQGDDLLRPRHEAPGVEVRPLRQITGEAEFNEVYMTDVRVPDDCRIGDEGEGWRASLTTLMNERTAIGSGGAPKRGSGIISALMEAWRALPEDQKTSAKQDQVMSLWIRAETLRLTNLRASNNRRIGNPGPEGSIGKLASSSLNQDILNTAVTLEGAKGMIGYDYTFRRPEDLSVSGLESGVHHGFLRVRANSIEGGTSEIMKNILGEQVLGLPGEPRVDKNIPWTDVPKS